MSFDFPNTIAVSNGLSDFHIKWWQLLRKCHLRSIPLQRDTVGITNILIRPNLKTTQMKNQVKIFLTMNHFKLLLLKC